jgi:hypothetical protein
LRRNFIASPAKKPVLDVILKAAPCPAKNAQGICGKDHKTQRLKARRSQNAPMRRRSLVHGPDDSRMNMFVRRTNIC